MQTNQNERTTMTDRENPDDGDIKSRRVTLKRWKSMSNNRSNSSIKKTHSSGETLHQKASKKAKEKDDGKDDDDKQNEKSVKIKAPDLTRIQQLSKPTKSTLLHTWQTYSDVFDFDRMKKVMNKLHMEFTLTPEEKISCMEHLRQNATNLCNKLALGSKDVIRKYRLNTSDIQRLSGMTKQKKWVKFSRRTEELACPKAHKVLATWDDYCDVLPLEKRIKFHRKYVESVARIKKSESRISQEDIHQTTQSQRRRVNNVDTMVTPPKSSGSLAEEHDRMMARAAAYKLVEKGVERAMMYAEEGRPPPLMSRTLIRLSDNILAVLSDRNLIKIPMRGSEEKNAKFLMYVSDWTAKIISDAYLASEKTEKKIFTKKYMKGTSDKGIQETILEQDEDKEENEKEDKEKVKNVKEMVEKPFEDISEIDNSFGNDSDWDEETGMLKDEVIQEVKKLSITNSNTEIIHIRKVNVASVESQKDTKIDEDISIVEDEKSEVDKNLQNNNQACKIDDDKNIEEKSQSSKMDGDKSHEETSESSEIDPDKILDENTTKMDGDKNHEEKSESYNIDGDENHEEKSESCNIEADENREEKSESCKINVDQKPEENSESCNIDGDQNHEEISESCQIDGDKNHEENSLQDDSQPYKIDDDKTLDENLNKIIDGFVLTL